MRGVLWRGAVSGVAGAIGFIVWSMAVYGLLEMPWKPVNLVAATFWAGAPDDAAFSLPAAVLGFGVLLAVGVVMGVGYGALAVNMGLRHSAMLILIAVTLANVLWVFGHFLVWPAINEAAASQFDTLTAWIGHWIYGLVMGLVLVALGRHSALTASPGGEPRDFTYRAANRPMDL